MSRPSKTSTSLEPCSRRSGNTFKRANRQLRGLVPRKFLCLSQSVGAHVRPETFVLQCSRHLGRDVVDIQRVKQCSLTSDDLRQTRGICTDDYRTAGHGFQYGETEPFMP